LLDLTNRPLLDTAADRGRFVDREGDLSALLHAVELRFNVLLVAERGAGASSLLARVAAAAAAWPAPLPPVRRVPAGRLDTPARLLAGVARELGDEAAADAADEEAALAALARVTAIAGSAVIVLDGLSSGRLVHAVFGRMRDELWALGDLRWVVAVPADEEALALTPPADQFFETIHRLAPLDVKALVELLRRRDPDGRLDDRQLEEIAGASRGNPSTALRLARAAVTASTPSRPVQDVVDEIGRQLGEPAARLAAALSQAGSSGPSDDALLERLGWSRPRAYEVFRSLEEHGYLTTSQERSGRPGRPRKVFRLKDAVK